MNQIEKQIDRIIAALKLNEELKSVRFVREYGPHNVENPISGLLAVVSVTDTSLSKSYIGGYLSSTIKGDSYAAKAEIRVYAPATENGSGLSEIVSELLTGLKKADSQKIIVEVFERFYKADKSRSQTSTGLGLAIAKEMTEKLDGRIKAIVVEGLFEMHIEFMVE